MAGRSLPAAGLGRRACEDSAATELIATTGTALQPGEQTKAGIDVKSGNDIDLNAASTATMTEASPEALQRMLPKLVKGSAPQNNTQIVISRTLADNLGASLGSTVTFVAPPFDGWMSLDGRIGEAVADTQRAWTVSGLTDESEAVAWGLEGWPLFGGRSRAGHVGAHPQHEPVAGHRHFPPCAD